MDKLKKALEMVQSVLDQIKLSKQEHMALDQAMAIIKQACEPNEKHPVVQVVKE